MITIDIANPETDLDSLRNLITTMMSEEEREAAYKADEYVIGSSNEISQNHIENIVQSNLIGGAYDDVPETTEEYRELLERQRNSYQKSEFEKELTNCILSVFHYVYLGKNKSGALASQRKALSNDWEMSMSVPVMNLD